MDFRCWLRFALPFDWAFSSPVMVCDCLADDFKALLDPREYVAMGRRGAGVGHRRYALLRLPGRWQRFTFLHHDPLRKRQDHDYLKRSVERFRRAARAPGRKIFIVTCLVDRVGSLEDVRRGAGDGRSGPSWGYFASSEIQRLFEALRDFGARDFHLAALVVCAGEASEAHAEPAVVQVPLSGGVQGDDSVSMREVHVLDALGAESDPFHFFEDLRNAESFSRAVLAGATVCPELDLLEQEHYDPSGYRDCLIESSNVGLDFVCRCCDKAFPTRNKLFSHIRSSASCARSIADHDSTGFRALVGEIKVFAILLGTCATWTEAMKKVQEALDCVAGAELLAHTRLNDDVCPCVALPIFCRMSCALRGDALHDRVKERFADKGLVLHKIVQTNQAVLLDWQRSLVEEHHAYLLPFEALCDEAPEDFAKRQEIYRSFKQALGRRKAQEDAETCLTQLKMTERLSIESIGKEFVVVKVVGPSASIACALLESALARHHGIESFRLPSEMRYLEGQRFSLEKRHGPIFGQDYVPFGPNLALATWRSELQKALAACWKSGFHARSYALAGWQVDFQRARSSRAFEESGPGSFFTSNRVLEL